MSIWQKVEMSMPRYFSIDVNLYGLDYRVIGFYRPPGLDKDSYIYLRDSVKCFQHLCSTDKLVVMLGDFNLPLC